MKPETTLGRHIWIVDKYFRKYLKIALKSDDLNTAEGLTLLVLYGADGVNQEQIIKELQFDKGVMTRTVKSLEDKGYVVKATSPDDGRATLIKLTARGIEYKSRLISILNDWNRIALQGISEEMLQITNNVLSQMMHQMMLWENDQT